MTNERPPEAEEPGADEPGADEPGADEAQDERAADEPETRRGERPLGMRLTGAAMRGLHRAIYGGQDDAVVIVADASGDPPSPDGLDLHLDPDHPEASTVVVHSRPVARRPAPRDGNEERDGKQDG